MVEFTGFTGFPAREAAEVSLRPVHDSDVPVFFRWANDPESNQVAAFTSPRSADWDRFTAHWTELRTSADTDVRTILADGDVAGHAGVWGEPGRREVTYWVDRSQWGRGIATGALRLLLAEIVERPLRARAAADNVGSLRVLEKCGFRPVGRERAYANARAGEVDEVLLALRG
ncbi:GNAT family N-acetyltransferase [Streptomyces sp. NPDC059009]|uniref:GNAT family N-acetyltransferase n=1 Tax=Streptomyces sp. NPDC059009 TaxID=3346694 RepID=UPI0036C01AEC